jgi:CRP-like cAMP-binding protein
MIGQDLAHLSIFQGFTKEQINHLLPMLQLMHYHKDDLIFQQGRPAEFLHVLLTGEVIISYKPYDGPPLTVARLSSGEVFGWSTAMRHEAYSSTAIAQTDVEVLRISGDQLRCLCDNAPDTGAILLERLAGNIAERLRSTHAQVINLLTNSIDTNGKCAGASRAS